MAVWLNTRSALLREVIRLRYYINRWRSPFAQSIRAIRKICTPSSATVLWHQQKRPIQEWNISKSDRWTTWIKGNDENILHNDDKRELWSSDGIPHLNFSYLYEHLSQRCTQADILLLGASIWYNTLKDWPKGTCFDADRRTFGAYGLLVKRSAFHPILHWLDRVNYITFDHIYRYLQQSGLIVRVAYPPFLVIMDVSHPSLVNNRRMKIQFDVKKRAKIHDWHLKNYPVATILPRARSADWLSFHALFSNYCVYWEMTITASNGVAIFLWDHRVLTETV